MGDDDIDDDILQLLSRPSSANTSNRRRSRKKVTFSNASIFNDTNDEKQSNGVSTSLQTSNIVGSSNDTNNAPKSLPIKSTKDDTVLINGGNNDDDILPSFSRSKRVVNQSYNGHSVDDINELFQINPTK